MTPFETKCKIIGDMFIEYPDELKELWEQYDVSSSIAWALDRGLVLDISDEAEQRIETLWLALLEEYGKADTGLTSYQQLVD
jgi:thiamine biosynthesis protein ThiC